MTPEPMLKHPNRFTAARYIGICAHPKSGKSLAAEILQANYGAEPIDSGLPLRQIAMTYFGLSHDQVFTQSGKMEYITILGRKWQAREFLGELGNKLEEMHGEWVMPFMVTRTLDPHEPGPYVDASVRKSQGGFYKQAEGGGVVIGIRRPDVGPSPYAFDRFDEDKVDIWIENDGLARGLSHHAARRDLEIKIDKAIAALQARAH